MAQPPLSDLTSSALDRARHHANEYLAALDCTSVAATTDLATLRNRLIKPLADHSLPADQVLDELVADCEGGIIGCTGPRFFAWVVGGAAPASLGADWLSSVWDQPLGIYAAGPAAAVAEEAAGIWLKDLLGLPQQASFALLTGCQMAHATCLAAARHRVLADRGWNVEEDGLAGSPPIRLVCGDSRHGSLERAVRLLGLGKRAIVNIPVDDESRLQPETLAAELEREPNRPTIVLLQAGELSTGAYDPFDTLIPVAKAHKAWVHVDGAFGLWAAASPRFRHFLKAVELADSWATDGHKWLNVPYDSGFAFVRDSEAHSASMSNREPYLAYNSEAREPMDWTPEWSRRARGIPTYAAIRQQGRHGIAELIDRCCDNATALVKGIGALPGAQIMWEPQINQGLLRFYDDDARTDEVIDRILASGEAYFGGTNWRGMRCMRVSVSNWRTTQADVDRTIAAFAKILTPRS